MSSYIAEIDVVATDRPLGLDESEVQGWGEKFVREEEEELKRVGDATTRALIPVALVDNGELLIEVEPFSTGILFV